MEEYSFSRGRIVLEGKDVLIFQLRNQEVTSLQ